MNDARPWRVIGGPSGSPRGTAWAIAPRLAVTAAHVIVAESVEVNGTLARRRAVEAEYDVAVLDLPDGLPSEPCRCAVPQDRAPATVVGWPSFTTTEPAVLEGSLYVDRDGSCALQVDRPRLEDRSWEGVSGAPVWSDGAVVGLVTRIHPAHGMVRLTTVEQFVEMLPAPMQPLPSAAGTDPRGSVLVSARDELLRGTSNRGLAYVAAAGFDARRFGRALSTALRERPDACEVVATGSLGGSALSLAGRLLRAFGGDQPSRGSDTLRAQLALESRVTQAAAESRRFVLHLQGLSHITTEEALQLGNLLAAVCQHDSFRLFATGGRRIRELQAAEFHQHSAFHEISYPRLAALNAHQCDRLVDGLGVPEGWLWSESGGHPALTREIAQLLVRGIPVEHAIEELLLYSDFLTASKHRLWADERLRAAAHDLAAANGRRVGHGYDRVLDDLSLLGLVDRTGEDWKWVAPLMQVWARWIGLT